MAKFYILKTCLHERIQTCIGVFRISFRKSLHAEANNTSNKAQARRTRTLI